MKKVLFFDIDGTLVNAYGVVPESARAALAQARRNGHEIVICSGRSGHQMAEWMYEDFDGVINCTGARVMYNGNIIYEHFVPCEDVKRARETLELANGILVGQTEERTVLSQESYEYLYDFLIKAGRSKERIDNMLGNALITDHMEECDSIKKFFYHRSAKTVDELTIELGDIFEVDASSFLKNKSDCGEIVCKGITKSLGMQKYIEYRGIGKEDTIAFGDGPNDIDMLSFAHIGVAMGNGCEEAKAVADMVTDSINDHGIRNAMLKLGIID